MYRSKWINPNTGNSFIVSDPGIKYNDYVPINVPCNKCVGCLMQRARSWAVRCVLEASLWVKNCFITLTYSPEYLPDNGTLVKEHFVLFMKRLRKKFGDGIRFYMCGEYGEHGHRPHYHACLFNFDFPDKVLYRKSESGSLLYRSPSLEKLWPFGFSTIGEVTEKSAAYVARYVLKKYDSNYMPLLPPDGCIEEYTNMSRKPGIAHDWFQKFFKDVYPLDLIVVNDKFKVKPPRYFDSLMTKIDENLMIDLKQRRLDAYLSKLESEYPDDVEELRYWSRCHAYLDRLHDQEEVARVRAKKFERGF